MSLQTIEQEYKVRYPIFKAHNAKFWETNEGTFCQAFNEQTQEHYGNKFKLDVQNFTFKKV